MRRLEYTRRVRSGPAAAKSPTEAVMVLAHVARERNRLEQERSSLEKRMRRIEARLTEIAGTETKLMPFLHAGLQALSGTMSDARMRAAAATPEATLQY